MKITDQHIESKKRIGHLGHNEVVQVTTTGGLTVVVGVKNGVMETLGSGPHPLVARWIAKKRCPDIVFTELTKGDYVSPAHFQDLLPQYEDLTNRMRQTERKK